MFTFSKPSVSAIFTSLISIVLLWHAVIVSTLLEFLCRLVNRMLKIKVPRNIRE